MLENGVSDFEPKSLTTHSVPNAQQSRNAARSLSRAITGAQVSNLGMENVPASSTNKKLGKSEAHLGEREKKKQLFWPKRTAWLLLLWLKFQGASGNHFCLCCNPCMLRCLDIAAGTFLWVVAKSYCQDDLANTVLFPLRHCRRLCCFLRVYSPGWVNVWKPVSDRTFSLLSPALCSSWSPADRCSNRSMSSEILGIDWWW